MCFHEFIGYFNSPKYPTDRLIKTTFNNVLLQGDTMHLKALDQQLSVFHVVRTCFLTRYVDLLHCLYMQTQLHHLGTVS